MKKLLKENPLSTKSFMYSHFIQIFVQGPKYTKHTSFKVCPRSFQETADKNNWIRSPDSLFSKSTMVQIYGN